MTLQNNHRNNPDETKWQDHTPAPTIRQHPTVTRPPQPRTNTLINDDEFMILIKTLFGGAKQLIGWGIAIIGIVLIFSHWYTSTSISHESVSSLEKMSCSKFNSLSQANQQTVATRISTAQTGDSSGSIGSELGGGDLLMGIQSSCQSNPNSTVWQQDSAN